MGKLSKQFNFGYLLLPWCQGDQFQTSNTPRRTGWDDVCLTIPLAHIKAVSSGYHRTLGLLAEASKGMTAVYPTRTQEEKVDDCSPRIWVSFNFA